MGTCQSHSSQAPSSIRKRRNPIIGTNKINVKSKSVDLSKNDTQMIIRPLSTEPNISKNSRTDSI